MFGRYWNFTTCIRCDDLNAISQSLTSLLEEEGCHSIKSLPPLTGSVEQLQAHNPWNQSYRPWIVALFAGNEGWTIVKTWPTELLCHRVIDDYCFRLPILTKRLGCDAFYLGVYGDDCGFLLEANATGQSYLSGAFHPNISDDFFYQLPIDAPDLIRKFFLLEVPESFQAAMRVNKDPKMALKEAEYQRLKAEENPDWDSLNALRDEVGQGYTERIDRALETVMDASHCWYFDNLAYWVSAYPEKLAAAGAHLLYFQPPINHKAPSAYCLNQTELEINNVLTESQLNEIVGLEAIDD